MYTNFSKFSSEAQRVNFPTIGYIAIGYIVVGLLLFNHYDGKVKNTKLLLLNENYNLILEASLNRLQSLASNLNTNLQSSYILLNNNSIKICKNKNCISYALQKLESSFKQSIPNFNKFKIELNNDLIYSNFASDNYEIEKVYYLNQDNKLIIRASIDNNYWNQLVGDIRRPLWVMIAFLLFSFIILCYIHKALSRKFEKEYKNKYETEIKNCEKLWMTKFWDNEFKKTKDVEINYLFHQEAAKIALSKEKNSLFNLEENLFCSIALYPSSFKEEIDVKKLIRVFSNRFDKEDENISFSITCHKKQIYFSSTAAFYQIIYSIISYLFFIVKKQFYSNKHQIDLFITDITDHLSFSFNYSGVALEKETDLFAVSNEFTKSHANPFILNIEQIFKLLKLNGFNCKVSYDKMNLIEISEKTIKKTKIAKGKNNIIYLANWDKEEE